MPLSYREFWHRPPTIQGPEPVSVPGCGQHLEKSWCPRCRGLDKLDHRRVGATPTTDQSRAYGHFRRRTWQFGPLVRWHASQPQPCPTPGSNPTTRRTSPGSCAVPPPTTCTAAPSSRRARWRPLLDHRRAGRGASTPPCPHPGADRHPAPYPSPVAAPTTTNPRQPRRSRLDALARAPCSTRGPGEQRLLSHRHTHPDAVSSPRRLRPGAPATASEGGLTSETCQRTSTNASQPSSRRSWRTPRSCRRCRGSTSRR